MLKSTLSAPGFGLAHSAQAGRLRARQRSPRPANPGAWDDNPARAKAFLCLPPAASYLQHQLGLWAGRGLPLQLKLLGAAVRLWGAGAWPGAAYQLGVGAGAWPGVAQGPSSLWPPGPWSFCKYYF